MIMQKMKPLVTNYDNMINERCLRCGRILKNEQSRIVGYGPSCYKKYLKETKNKKRRRLF